MFSFSINNPSKIYNKALPIFCASFFILQLIFTIYYMNSFNISNERIVAPSAIAKSISFPYLNGGYDEYKQFTFSADIHRKFLAPSRLNIIPDDRVTQIKVNNQIVDLSGVDSGALQNVERGFDLNLKSYLVHGVNTIEVSVLDFGGEYGLNIKASSWTPQVASLLLGWAVLCCILLFWSIKKYSLRLDVKLAYFLIIVFNILQVWVIFKYNPVDHIWSDAARHWEQGVDVLRQDLMSFTDPIFYQLYIGALAKLTLKIPALVAYFTCLLALLTPFTWYRFFRELQSSKNIALWGCVVISALPSWMAIYSYFMQETLMLPLLGLALWATWRCRRKGTAASFVLMVCIWILAGLTRGVTIPFAAVCCTWLWLYQENKLKKAGLSIIAMTLIMGPLIYRSYTTLNHFAPHGMGHLNIIYSKSGKKEIQIKSYYNGGAWQHGFSSPSLGMKPFSPLSDWQTQRSGTVFVEVDLKKGKQDWDTKIEELDLSFNDYLWIVKENFIFALFAQSWPDNNMARLVDRLGSNMRWVWFPLFVLCIVMMVLKRKQLKGQWMLPSLIAAWFLVQVLLPISVNEGRYRKPLEGLLIAQFVLMFGLLNNSPSRCAPKCIYLAQLQNKLTNKKEVSST